MTVEATPLSSPFLHTEFIMRPLLALSRAFVLHSGGIDSTTALCLALQQYSRVTAISIDYGQRHKKEIEAARDVCNFLMVAHETLSIGDLLKGEHVMLTDEGAEIPHKSYDDIKGISPTYVPFRNGTMLSILTAHAMKYVEHVRITNGLDPDSEDLKDLVGIYFGAHAEDARNWAYPDCTPEFIGAMANAIYIGSYRTVRLHAPFAHYTKAEIIQKGLRVAAPYVLTWSCYAGGEKHCGRCPTCLARKQAFLEARVQDPTEYEA